jgi:hypothetical protein
MSKKINHKGHKDFTKNTKQLNLIIVNLVFFLGDLSGKKNKPQRPQRFHKEHEAITNQNCELSVFLFVPLVVKLKTTKATKISQRTRSNSIQLL